MHRLRQDWTTLAKEIDKHVTKQHQYTPGREGIALPVDDDMKYLMIADFHSILSEVDACIEGMKKFTRALHDHVNQPVTKQQCIEMIDSWMHARGIDPTWFSEMAGCRNFIAHDGSFYLALDTTESSWDLLLVKKNVKQFDDPSTYVRFSRVVEIVECFLDCRGAMQAHLVALFNAAK